MAIGVRISLKGLQQTVARLQALQSIGTDGAASRTELHRRYGVAAWKWIQENFKSEGGLLEDGKWRPLSENTVAGRRKGTSRILQDTGAHLRPSFNFVATSTEVRVGSPSKLALWHNEGTRGPYPIVPRFKKALAFPVSANFARFAKTTSFNSSAGTSVSRFRATKVTRAMALRSASSSTGRLRIGQNIVFAKGVMHPGLVKRRMLPNERELMPRLIVATQNWLAGVNSKNYAERVTSEDGNQNA